MSNLSDFFPGGSPTTDGGTIPDNISLNDLVDVSLTSPIVNEVLFYNGSIWVDKQLEYNDLDPLTLPVIPATLDDLSDVGVGSPTDGQYLQYNTGSGLWVPSDITTVSLTLEQLTNVTINSPAEAQSLTYNSTTSEWINSELAIDNLSDVDTTTTPPTNGQVLTWNGTNTAWEPTEPPASDKLEDADADTYISVSEVDDQVTVQAGPDNGYIMLKPNTSVDADAAVVIDDGTGNAGSIELKGTTNGELSSTLGMDITATNNVTIQGIAYPNADGTAGQIMSTDGAGAITFTDNTSSIDELTDVDITGIVDDNVLVWSTDKFVAGTIGSLLNVAFTDLTDTPVGYGTAGQVVIVNGTVDGLEYGDAPAAALAGLTDTTISGTPQNKFLKNIAGIWNDSTIEISDVNSLQTVLDGKLTGTSLLTDLGNVNVPAPNNNDVLYWNTAANEWQSKAPTDATTFIGLSDTPGSYGGTDGQMLVNSGSNTLAFAPVPETGVPEAPTGSGVLYGRQDSNWVAVPDAQSDRIQDADNDTFVDVTATDDRVTIQAGPDDGNIYLQPNTTVNADSAVVIDDGTGNGGSIDLDGTSNGAITSTLGVDISATNDVTIQGLTYPKVDGANTQVLTTDGAGTLTWTDKAAGGATTFVGLGDTPSDYTGADGFTVTVSGGALVFTDVKTLGEAPVDTAQYTRKDAAWSAVGAEDIDMSTAKGIVANGSNLLNWTLSGGSDPLFPNVTFVHVGETGMAIDIDAVLFAPLKLKNDTSIQGYLADYSGVQNMVSMSADDFVTIGDGGTAQTAIRSENASLDPVVRQGTFGSTTDFKILHTGDNISSLADVDTTGATAGQVLTWNGTDTWTPTTVTSGGGIQNIVEDTTPQLGGNLDANGFGVFTVASSTGNTSPVSISTGETTFNGGTSGDITLTSGIGTANFGNSGNVALASGNSQIASGDVTITTGNTEFSNSGEISLTTGNNTDSANSGGINLTTGSSSSSTGAINIVTGDSDGSPGQISIKTGASTGGSNGIIQIVTPYGGAAPGVINIDSETNGTTTIKGPGSLNISSGTGNWSWPTAKGAVGQVLTEGSDSQLVWSSAGGDVSGKADKIVPATVGDFASLDAGGNLTDSGSSASDFATAVHTHTKADITDFSDGDYATAAQGTLAGTATQPGDNVSTLINDAGYITSAPSVISDLTDVNTAGATSGQVLTWNGTDTWTPTTVSGGSASPLTTKGDIYTYDSDDARLPVGTDGQVLTADSAQGTGVKWADAAGGGGGSTFEYIRITYFGTTPDVIDETSAGITSATLVDAFQYCDFEFAYDHPPTSIVYYAYKDLGSQGFGYKMTMPAAATLINEVLTGGTSGNPGAVLTNMSPAKIKLRLTASETNVDGSEHAYVFFTF